MWLPNMITLVLGFQNSNENLSNTLRPRRSSEWLIIISWLIFTFPAMQAHQWVLDNMDKWVEKYLIADNSIRIRNGRWSCRYNYEKRWPCSDIFVHCDSLSKYSNVGGIGHFKVARETGSRWLSSALWDSFGGRIFNIATNLFPKTVPQCTLTTISTRSPAQLQSGE